MVDSFYALSGFAVGLLVGMTGVGGGSLMTPLLILVFGINPATAVGTDLLFAAATKSAGSLLHGLNRSIEWQVVRRLAFGSVPATVATIIMLSFIHQSQAARSLITLILCGALLITATLLIFRGTIVKVSQSKMPTLDDRHIAMLTVLFGGFVGLLVSTSSIGAGAIGVCALVFLYPKLPMAKIIGSDIAHAVPLTLVAGAGHWMIGTVDWRILGWLLVGSVPGILIGVYAAVRVSEAALRTVLATTLIIVAAKLLYNQVEASTSIVSAFTRRSPH